MLLALTSLAVLAKAACLDGTMCLGGPRPPFALLLDHCTLLGPRLTDSDHYRPGKSPGEFPIWKCCSPATQSSQFGPQQTHSFMPPPSNINFDPKTFTPHLLCLHPQRPVSGPRVTPDGMPTTAAEQSTLIPIRHRSFFPSLKKGKVWGSSVIHHSTLPSNLLPSYPR